MSEHMREPHRQSVRGVTYPALLVSICCTAMTVVLSSCSADLHVQRGAQEEGAPAVSYSIVCVIHGDGDYLYHDTSGNEYRADEEALTAVKRVAQRNPGAEVFIFHQKPRRRLLLVFPLHDGEFYYYRNGRLIANESYWRDEGQSPLDPETGLYRRFHADNQPKMASLFLYYGHGIPELGGAGYDASSPDRTFSIHGFAAGLKGFRPHSTKFDLMVLSTCFGGTPLTIGTLGAFARYIVASPDNLHLSYLDLHALERLDLSMRDGDVHAFARRFAHQAFDELAENIQTAVSVAVYDVDRVQVFLHAVDRVYDHALTTLQREAQASPATIERCDCADLPAYMLLSMHEGVDVFYRPARFGRTKHKQTHSGWECISSP
jgi:hypothetical protein